MKLRSKVLLASCSLLAISGTAAATSTFAWYTANRQATLGISHVGAVAQVTNLSVVLKDDATDTVTSKDLTAQETTDKVSVAFDADAPITDVSGDGTGTFVKPKWGPLGEATTTNFVGWWDAGSLKTATTCNEFDKFTLTFTATGTEEVYLYLSPLTTVTAGTTDFATSVVNSARFSTTTADTEAMHWYCNPKGTDTQYMEADGSSFKTTSTVATANVLDKTASTGFFSKTAKYTEADLTKGTNGTYKTNTGYLADLKPTAEKTASVDVTFYVWIEGTDADCTFAGSTHFAATYSMRLGFYTLLTSVMTAA